MGKYNKGTRFYIDEDLKKRLDEAESLLSKRTLEYLKSLPFRGYALTDGLRRMQLLYNAAAATGYDAHSLNMSDLTDKELESLATPQEKAKYHFESRLKTRHIEILLPVVNEFVFVERQTVESMREWLACEHKKPVRVKKNYLVAYMMYLLAKNSWICKNWQKVAEEMNVFSNKKTLTQKNLSKCLTQATIRYGKPFSHLGDVVLNQEIYDAVMRLER